MAGVLVGALALVIAIVAFILVIGIAHAFTAKMITGKWPHQCARAKGVYDAMNNATKGANHDQ